MLLYKDIIKDDNPLLREKSEDVNIPLSLEDAKTIRRLNQYLVDGYDEEITARYELRPGVGLAAPQIGVLKKMFVILVRNFEGSDHHYAVINPKIVSHSEALIYLPEGEGCLSVDRQVDGLIHRYRRIKARVHLFDFETGYVEKAELQLEGFLSIIFQHEYDHLHGTLFYDRINESNPFYIPTNSQPVFRLIDNNEN